MNSHKETEARH